MNEFERRRRNILINRDLAPFPYYVKITPGFKQEIAYAYDYPNYDDFVSAINLDYGEVVASGDYITETLYLEIFDIFNGSIDLTYHDIGNNGFVSEIKVSNNINNINTIIEEPVYYDFTTSFMDLSEINTSSSSYYSLSIYNLKVISEMNFQEGALRKIILPKNLNNSNEVIVNLQCYLDTKDVEIIFPSDMRVLCLFYDIKKELATPTNKFILKVPIDKVAEYTSDYSEASQLYPLGNYEIVGY